MLGFLLGSAAQSVMSRPTGGGPVNDYADVPLFVPGDQEADWRVNLGYVGGEGTAGGTASFLADGYATGVGAFGRTGTSTASRLFFPHHNDFTGFVGAFTIECMNYRWTTTSSRGIFSKYSPSNGVRSWAIRWNGDQVEVFLSTDGNTFTTLLSGSLPTNGVWRHICLERNDEALVRLYVDGVVTASTTLSGTIYNNTTKEVELGGHDNGSGQSNDRHGQFRITRGRARYNGAFTPPSIPLPRPA